MEPSGLCEKQDIILNVKLLKLLNSANTTFTYLILLGKQYAVPNLAIWKYIHHLTMQAIFNLILLPYIFISVCNQQYLPTNCKYQQYLPYLQTWQQCSVRTWDSWNFHPPSYLTGLLGFLEACTKLEVK